MKRSRGSAVHQVGIATVWVGIISSIVGLIVGFLQLPSGDGTKIEFWLSLIPVGFALLVLGTAMVQLSKGKE